MVSRNRACWWSCDEIIDIELSPKFRLPSDGVYRPGKLEGETKLKKMPKQEYNPEFRKLSVKRVKAGQGTGAVALELGLIEQALRNWVKAATAGKLNGPGSKVVTPEHMEFSRVRAENIRVKRETEILKKATDAGYPMVMA
jgi:transposase